MGDIATGSFIRVEGATKGRPCSRDFSEQYISALCLRCQPEHPDRSRAKPEPAAGLAGSSPTARSAAWGEYNTLYLRGIANQGWGNFVKIPTRERMLKGSSSSQPRREPYSFPSKLSAPWGTCDTSSPRPLEDQSPVPIFLYQNRRAVFCYDSGADGWKASGDRGRCWLFNLRASL